VAVAGMGRPLGRIDAPSVVICSRWPRGESTTGDAHQHSYALGGASAGVARGEKTPGMRMGKGLQLEGRRQPSKPSGRSRASRRLLVREHERRCPWMGSA